MPECENSEGVCQLLDCEERCILLQCLDYEGALYLILVECVNYEGALYLILVECVNYEGALYLILVECCEL